MTTLGSILDAMLKKARENPTDTECWGMPPHDCDDNGYVVFKGCQESAMLGWFNYMGSEFVQFLYDTFLVVYGKDILTCEMDEITVERSG